MISRALFADAVKVVNGEVSKAGPLIEYERRIEAGDLVDGDNCQVGTIRELQRLYDELANSAEACQLDWYAASEKLAGVGGCGPVSFLSLHTYLGKYSISMEE
ncbi:hypothetical protein CsSME_00028182 [Camellia sinensis var. sinensis]